MNLLDENIPEAQRELLRRWRIRTRQIGFEEGRFGMKDDEIIPLLHLIRRVTFLTRDLGFCRGALCHPHYCLVGFFTTEDEFAFFVRRFLQHPDFDTLVKRMGSVIRVSHTGLKVWRARATSVIEVAWPD
jgi:hypothetical protein